MRKNLIIGGIIIIVGLGSFFAGYKYGQTKNSGPAGNFGNFANLSIEQRQQMRETGLNSTSGSPRMGQAGAGFISGEIINKDENSLTVKLNDGGSKIVFFTDLTNFIKTVKSSVNDFNVGERISATGQANEDGSLSAQSIQIRPAELPEN